MVINGVAYDVALEKACLMKKIATCSQCEKQGIFNTANKLLKLHLMDLWKKRESPFADKIPKYQAEIPQDDLGLPPGGPELRLCSFVDGCLVLARDVRQQFLTCPIRSPDWRKVLQEFDRTFGTPTSGAAPAPAPAAETSGSGPSAAASFDWARLFPGEPSDPAVFQQQFSGKIKGKFAFCPEVQCYIVAAEEPIDEQAPEIFRLYLEATSDYQIEKESQFLTYGAGTWLTESKADNFLETAHENHRGVLCEFKSSADRVVLEEWGGRGMNLT